VNRLGTVVIELLNPYITHLLILIMIYAVLALSLNFALGYAGMLNLGHVALFGVGAYTSALLTKAGVSFELSFLAAGLLAAVLAYFLASATNRLKGDYLALAALGFNFVVFSVLLNWTSLTRGPLGISKIPKPSLLGFAIADNTAYLALVSIFAIASSLVIYRIVKSPYGRLVQATRDDEISVRVLGKDSFKTKSKALAISGFFAGLCGSLFAHYISYIDPFTFGLNEIIFVLIIVILGGLASIKGSIAAAALLVLLPEALRFVALPATMTGPLRQVIYALILLAILLYRPRGFFGRVDLQ
jgi:branched-chain amino acid transport system permease protein